MCGTTTWEHRNTPLCHSHLTCSRSSSFSAWRVSRRWRSSNRKACASLSACNNGEYPRCKGVPAKHRHNTMTHQHRPSCSDWRGFNSGYSFCLLFWQAVRGHGVLKNRLLHVACACWEVMGVTIHIPIDWQARYP